MKCPFCGHADSQVKDSRPSEDGGVIRRRRSCPECGGRFTTFERVQLRELTIAKRSGRRAPFDREKLVRSISIALRKRPVDPERSSGWSPSIVRQLESRGETEIPSSVVGELVMKALKSLDEVGYVRYASVYRDFRETQDFARFLGAEGLAEDGEDPVKPSERRRRGPAWAHPRARRDRWRASPRFRRSTRWSSAGAGAEPVLREFSDHRFGADIEGEALAAADEVFFQAIVRGVVEDQVRIDRAIVRRLAANWKLDRLDATVRAILRAGAFELLHRGDVPTEVVIDEYVELAKAFFDPTEAGFVNAALDAIAGDVRRLRSARVSTPRWTNSRPSPGCSGP